MLIKWSSFRMKAYSCEQHILQVHCKLMYMQSSTLQLAHTELNSVQIYITSNTKWLFVSKGFSYTQVTIIV